MRTSLLLVLAVLPGSVEGAAGVCDPAVLVGQYAFQLTGSTDISGEPHPAASLGRVAFDGRGSLTGTASATFRGLLLGNPVTGSYESKPDCTATWKLQDDSGAYQHFAGTFSTDGTRVQFSQTDAGGAQSGIMRRTPDTCSAADLRPSYSFTVSGNTTPMLPGQISRTVSAKGTLGAAETASFEVDRDCSVRFGLTIPAPEGGPPGPSRLNMRGFLVNGGKEILAFQTDPGAMVAARLNSALE